MSHFCKVCGQYKSNESFSGRGHAAHICKKCHSLPAAVREEMIVINRINGLPFRLSKANRKWLKKLMTDHREAVRREAKYAWEMRFNPTHDWIADEYEEDSWADFPDEIEDGPQADFSGEIEDGPWVDSTDEIEDGSWADFPDDDDSDLPF